MAKHKKTDIEPTTIRPASDPELREQQIINAAYDLAEKQIIEGTASSQVVTHFLKLGSIERQLELKRKECELELIKAKTRALESSERLEAMYADAINAMRRYQGDVEEADDNV